MRTGVIAAGLADALFCGLVWLYSILDAQDRIAHMTGSGGSYYGMDLIIANAAVVYGVLGVIVALVGLFLGPRAETDRAAVVRRRWAWRAVLAGSVLVALAGCLFLPIPFPFLEFGAAPVFLALIGSGVPLLVIGVILVFTAGKKSSAEPVLEGMTR